MSHDKTVTKSFRINASAFAALQEDANRQKVSVNTLVNQLLLEYAEFDRYVRKAQMLKLTTATFKKLLESAPDEAIIQAARESGASAPQAIILARDGMLTLDTVQNHLRMLADYANLFEYNEVSTASNRTITLMHNLGEKGSLFVGHYVQSLLESVEVSPTFTLTDQAVVLEFGLR